MRTNFSFATMRLLSYTTGACILSTACGSLLPHGKHESNPDCNPLGTLDTPNLPEFIHGPLDHGYPWGRRTTVNTNPSDPPHTGMTRYYDWTLTNGTVSPDGVSVRNILLINNQFPGPTIEANWGDWIEVKLTNAFHNEGTSLHWHGLAQKETQWSDGVPGVSVCPIAPGSSFTYRFRADQYGTSWWHSHVSQQYIGGVHGAMIIHGPNHVDYDIDLGPVMIGEWFHQDYETMVQRIMVPRPVGNIDISALNPDSLIINGRMNYTCQLSNTATNKTCPSGAGLARFKFVSGKKHRLRLINTGASAYQKFSIDNHNMTVIATDFVPIKPYTTNVLSIGVGQRLDIIVEATGKPTDSAWIRTVVSPSCSLVLNHTSSFAIVNYESAPADIVPTTTSDIPLADIDLCYTEDLSLTVPMFSMTPDPNPSLTIRLDIKMANNGSFNLWYINNSTYRADYNDPNLFQAKLGNTTFDPLRNMYNTGTSTSVRLVLYNYLVLSDHPMHLHGHNMYVLASGFGEWDGKSGIVNPKNPLRRDTQLLGQGQFNGSTTPENFFLGVPSYVVLQYEQDNPGVWPFHCHVSWHAADGFVINLLERPNDIKKIPIPRSVTQTCKEWAAWTGRNVVNEIDSGL